MSSGRDVRGPRPLGDRIGESVTADILLYPAAYLAFGAVGALILSRITGGDTLPVVLSTLAIAALFGPVRGRVRELVDRRFY